MTQTQKNLAQTSEEVFLFFKKHKSRYVHFWPVRTKRTFILSRFLEIDNNVDNDNDR
tara:strand:- start:106 stop:276 length:171 start_codon:yes stop_codon:yes gene_type:complete